MSDLREQIQGLVDKHDVDSYRASVGAEHSSYPSAAVTTDRILALIAEAMLSEESVEAAAFEKWKHGGYASSYEDISTSMHRTVRKIIEYSLTAAGITGAGQEGGEGDDTPAYLRLVNEANKRHNEQNPDKRLPTLDDDGFVAHHWPGHPRF